MKKMNWDRAKTESGWIVAVVLAFTLVGTVLAVSPNQPTGPISQGSFVSPCTYAIALDASGSAFARNCKTGAVDYMSANATIVIQSALNAAVGGGTVFLQAGTYAVTGPLVIPGGATSNGGITLEGTGYLVGGSNAGAIIHNTASGVSAIQVAGAFGFHILNLGVEGSNSGDSGISLVTSAGAAPRSGSIEGVTVWGVAGDCIHLDAFSYVLIQNSFTSGGVNGLNITGSGLSEFLSVQASSFQSSSGVGIRIGGPSIEDTFNDVDIADAGIGIKLVDNGASGPYLLDFQKVSIARPVTYGIEAFADHTYLARIVFGYVDINMKGVSAAEKAIYFHRTGGYNIDDFAFNFCDVYLAGLTVPTVSIDFSGATSGSWTGLDSSGGTHVASLGSFSWNFINHPRNGAYFVTGTGAATVFTTTIDVASPYPGGLAIVAVTNAGNITYGADYSNTQGSTLSITITFQTPPGNGRTIKVLWQLETYS